MKSVRDLDVASKRVLVRVDYNLPMDEQGQITDDNRIRETLPLIEHLMARQAKIILMSHMGRPGGKVDPRLSLAPAAQRLSELLGDDVGFIDECVGDAVQKRVASLTEKEVLLLENLRFHDGEKSNDPDFAKELALLCDVYVNDAFAVSHRKQASVVALPEQVAESAAGFLLEKELQCYKDAVQNPKRPLVAVIGGAKVSSKLEALRNMLQYVDQLLIGGAMANTFLKAQGIDMGASRVEEDLIDAAKDIIGQAASKNIPLLLPEDMVAASRFDAHADNRQVMIGKEPFPEGWMALDIGDETAKRFSQQIQTASTIVWNGPMGVFEMPRFRTGTRKVATAIAETEEAFSIVGGGDTGLAAKVCGVAEKVSYISTGGGAFLHLMEGKTLPGAAVLF